MKSNTDKEGQKWRLVYSVSKFQVSVKYITANIRERVWGRKRETLIYRQRKEWADAEWNFYDRSDVWHSIVVSGQSVSVCVYFSLQILGFLGVHMQYMYVSTRTHSHRHTRISGVSMDPRERTTVAPQQHNHAFLASGTSLQSDFWTLWITISTNHRHTAKASPHNWQIHLQFPQWWMVLIYSWGQHWAWRRQIEVDVLPVGVCSSL